MENHTHHSPGDCYSIEATRVHTCTLCVVLCNRLNVTFTPGKRLYQCRPESHTGLRNVLSLVGKGLDMVMRSSLEHFIFTRTADNTSPYGTGGHHGTSVPLAHPNAETGRDNASPPAGHVDEDSGRNPMPHCHPHDENGDGNRATLDRSAVETERVSIGPIVGIDDSAQVITLPKRRVTLLHIKFIPLPWLGPRLMHLVYPDAVRLV
jgi:hypothetical protein